MIKCYGRIAIFVIDVLVQSPFIKRQDDMNLRCLTFSAECPSVCLLCYLVYYESDLILASTISKQHLTELSSEK